MAWRGGRTAGSGVWGPVVFRATHPAIDLLVPLAVSPGWPINPRRRTVPLPPFCAAICRPVSRLCWVKKSLFAESCSDGSFKLRVVGGLRAEFRPRALLTAGRCWQQRAQLAQPLSLGACTACCQSVPATVQTAECIRDCGLAGCPRLLSERTHDGRAERARVCSTVCFAQVSEHARARPRPLHCVQQSRARCCADC